MYYLNEKLIEAIQQDHLREAANARRNMIPKDPGGTAQTTSRVPSFAMGAVVPTAGKGAV